MNRYHLRGSLIRSFRSRLNAVCTFFAFTELNFITGARLFKFADVAASVLVSRPPAPPCLQKFFAAPKIFCVPEKKRSDTFLAPPIQLFAAPPEAKVLPKIFFHVDRTISGQGNTPIRRPPPPPPPKMSPPPPPHTHIAVVTPLACSYQILHLFGCVRYVFYSSSSTNYTVVRYHRIIRVLNNSSLKSKLGKVFTNVTHFSGQGRLLLYLRTDISVHPRQTDICAKKLRKCKNYLPG